MHVLLVESVVLLLLDALQVQHWHQANCLFFFGLCWWVGSRCWLCNPAIEAGQSVELLGVHLEGVQGIGVIRAEAGAVYVRCPAEDHG